jgi:hypothetical protein
MANEVANFYDLAYGYGPGANAQGDSQKVARDKYAQETLGLQAQYLRFLNCLHTAW